MSKNKLAYNELLSQHKLPVYFQDWWLDVACQNQNWDVLIDYDKGGKVRAVCPVVTKKKFGLRSIGLPVMTPYLGIHFLYPENLTKRERRYAFEAKVTKSLIKKLPSFHFYNVAFSPYFQNWTPFHWERFHSKQRYTYHMKGSLEEAFQNMKSETRSNIHSFEKKKLIITTDIDPKKYYSLSSEHAKRKGFDLPYAIDRFLKIDKVLKERSKRKIYAIKNDDQLLAATYILEDESVDYCLSTATSKHNDPSLITGLLWTAIQSSLNQQKTFDFEGSMLPGVESYFRSFGGERIPFLQLSKVPNPLLRGFLYAVGKI